MVVQVNAKMANRQSPAGPIIPEIRLHCLLRWLAGGGSYLEICSVSPTSKIFSTSKTLVLCFTMLFTSTLTCNVLLLFMQMVNIHSSTYTSLLQKLILPSWRLDFETSAMMVWSTVVWVQLMDGFGLSLYQQLISGTSYPTFPGHYQQHGSNVQSVCDSLGQFLFITVVAPGVQPDINAVERCDLLEYLQSFPCGYYLIGDKNVYSPSE
jgi:hypothetical protein